jgi:SAM-dependent methyltransferase
MWNTSKETNKYQIKKSRWKHLCDQFIDGYVDTFQPAKVLDLGCGAKKLSRNGTHVVGVDCSNLPGVDWVLNLEDEEFDFTEFDMLVMNNLLEHLYQPKKVLSKIYNSTARDVRIVATVPFIIKWHQIPNDYFRYTPSCLERIFKDSGFVDIEIVPLSSLGETLEANFKTFSGLASRQDSIKDKIFFRFAKSLISLGIKMYSSNSSSKESRTKIYTTGFGIVASKVKTN